MKLKLLIYTFFQAWKSCINSCRNLSSELSSSKEIQLASYLTAEKKELEDPSFKYTADLSFEYKADVWLYLHPQVFSVIILVID